MVKIDRFITKGNKRFFEYHCCESHDSADAELWYRSHQQVQVLDCDNDSEFGDLSFIERAENGTPLVYHILFEDGFRGSAFEDELTESQEEYCRPNPPKKQK